MLRKSTYPQKEKTPPGPVPHKNPSGGEVDPCRQGWGGKKGLYLSVPEGFLYNAPVFVRETRVMESGPSFHCSMDPLLDPGLSFAQTFG